MSDDGEEKIIDLGRTFHLTGRDRLRSPEEIAGDAKAAGPEKDARKRPDAPPLSKPKESEIPVGGPEFFDPESPDYKAFGWGGNKVVPTLRVIRKDDSEWPIVFAHLDTNPLNGSEFLPRPPGRKGQLIFLRVVGNDGVFMIVIEGIRLRRVWELIQGHLTPWIRELPDGGAVFADDEPVIWSVTAKEIKPERAG